MRPQKHEATGEGDLFRARLDQIINMKHELVQLAANIDWAWIDGEIAPLYSDKGRPGIESRFVIGLLLLKHMFGLSDEGVCERWVYDPYFQHFTGETFFQHTFSHERSDQPLEKAAGQQARAVAGREPAGGAPKRRAADQGSGAGHGRHHGAAQEHRLPNRRQAAACGDQGAQSLGSPPWRAAAAILSARRQAGGDDGGTLCPRQAVQPPPSRGALPAHPPGSADPRYPPQDQGPRARRGGLRETALAGLPDPLAAPAPTRLEALFLPRPGGRVHRQRQGPRALRVRRQGLDRHHQCLFTGRPVRAARHRPAGQSLRRPHIAGRHRGAPRASPDARSSAPTSTRDIAATMRPTRDGSSSPARSAASSASSNASCGDAPPSSPSSVI